jgi:hypothetical protein
MLGQLIGFAYHAAVFTATYRVLLWAIEKYNASKAEGSTSMIVNTDVKSMHGTLVLFISAFASVAGIYYTGFTSEKVSSMVGGLV